MFWRFGLQNVSAIEGLLDREGVTLEDLFEEEELIQEVKAHNSKLIDFLCKPDVLSLLMSYIWEKVDLLDETKRFKYPFLACEIICCEVYAICEAIMSQPQLLESLWILLDKPTPLNPLYASYFSKTNSVLLEKKTAEMISFIKAQPDIVKKLLSHISSSPISDLLLKLISIEDIPEGNGIVKWLHGEHLIPSLIQRLYPALDSETHNVASQTILDIIAVSYQTVNPQDPMLQGVEQSLAPPPVGGGNILIDQLKSEEIMSQLVSFMLEKTLPNTTSTLTNGINIIIELIRRYCSEIEQSEYQQHHYQMQPQKIGPPPPSSEKLHNLATDLNDLLRVLGRRLQEFTELLSSPRSIKGPIDTTIGKQIPLGSERLKICELFAEILHLQYLYTSSPLFDRLVCVASPSGNNGNVSATTATAEEASPDTHQDNRKNGYNNVADELVFVTDCFVESNILPFCLDLFFQFPWNNFLHSVVYDMIAKVFNTYTFTTTVHSNVLVGDDKDPIQAFIEVKMGAIRMSVRKLVASVFRDGQLTDKITAAQRQNDYEVDQKKGVRLGYMGHLTYISDEVCKLLEKCSVDLAEELRDCIDGENWEEYVSGILKETKEKDRQPLGGIRPNAPPQQHHVGIVGDEADTGIRKSTLAGNLGSNTSRQSGAVDSDEEDDDIDNMTIGADVYVSEGDVASDQFARYLCQQIVNDLPDRFLSGDQSDEEEEREWIGEFDGKEIDLNVQAGFDLENPFPSKISSLGNTFEADNGGSEAVLRNEESTVSESP